MLQTFVRAVLLAVVIPVLASGAETFTLSVNQGHAVPGGPADAKDVRFEFIPTRPLGMKNYYNPFTRMVEPRPVGAILHPIPVIRAAHVRAYDERPDLANVGLDDLATSESEGKLTAASKFMLVGDERGGATLLELSDVRIPEDKTDQWRVTVTAERVTLVEHVANPIADRGRAVLAKEPLPLGGRFLFGTRPQRQSETVLKSLDASKPAGLAETFGKAQGDSRIAANGTVVERTDMNTLKLTDRAGRAVGTIKLEGSEIEDFNVNADASRVVVGTERYVEDPDPTKLGHREVVSIVFTADGKRVAEVIDYDDACFCPDGNLIVTARGAGDGLFVADLKAGKVLPIRVTDPVTGKEAEVKWARNVSVSPDGQRVAYQSFRDAFVVNVDGTGWTPVWANPAHEPQARPTFSPDGRYVALVNVPLNVMNGPGELVVFDLARHVRQVIPGAKGADSEIPVTWAP